MTPPKSRDYKAPTYIVIHKHDRTIFPHPRLDILTRHPAARPKSANLPPRVSARPRAETRQVAAPSHLREGGRRLAAWTQRSPDATPLMLKAHFPLSALRGSTGGGEHVTTLTASPGSMGVRSVPIPGAAEPSRPRCLQLPRPPKDMAGPLVSTAALQRPTSRGPMAVDPYETEGSSANFGVRGRQGLE